MRKSKQKPDITRIYNPLEIKHFLSFGASFHVEFNGKTRPCSIGLVDAPTFDYSGIIATFEDGTSEFFDFINFNECWNLGFSV